MSLNIADIFSGSRVSHYGFGNGVGTLTGEHPYGEHPSRTLFVRNINSNVEDSELKSLFEVLFQLQIGSFSFALLVDYLIVKQ